MLRYSIKILYLGIALWLVWVDSNAQNLKYQVYPVGFYNVENLFDTELDSSNRDIEFTPKGVNVWTIAKYQKKINNIASVIKQMNAKVSPSGLAILGVSEIENKKVLVDLVNNPLLTESQFEIVHYDSPDRRGIDVALLYNPKLFKYKNSRIIPFHMTTDLEYTSRDILLVEGELASEKIHVLVNHWPSRYGSKSSPYREQAAKIVRQIVDSIYNQDDLANIIIMGDLNDDPSDKSVKQVLSAKKNKEDVPEKGLFNTMYRHYERGVGSLGYQGKWSLFDQIIISKPLIDKQKSRLQYWKSEIYNPDYLITKEGRYKGYPLRTFSGNLFLNGYSDHFPVILYLIKELKNGIN